MPAMQQIIPFLRVADMDRNVAFFNDVSGIEPGFRSGNADYDFLPRDRLAIRLRTVDQTFDPSRPEAQQVCYIDVDDVDALYAEFKSALDALPEGRVNAPPFDQFYGQREFHVIDEDTTLIMFGAPIANASDQSRPAPARM